MLTCEGKISAEECYNILESFQTNKTPGNDGIPIEFYKLFWPLISDPFLKCVNESFEKGEMSCSQKLYSNRKKKEKIVHILRTGVQSLS